MVVVEWEGAEQLQLASHLSKISQNLCVFKSVIIAKWPLFWICPAAGWVVHFSFFLFNPHTVSSPGTFFTITTYLQEMEKQNKKVPKLHHLIY